VVSFTPRPLYPPERDSGTHWIGGWKPEEKRPSGGPRRRWEDNIRVIFREIGWEGVHWIRLAQDRDQWQVRVNTVMKL
jgi:hypothetical protein